jgi:ribosomal protein L40E
MSKMLKHKRKCNNCFTINPQNSKRCSKCKTVFISSRKHSSENKINRELKSTEAKQLYRGDASGSSEAFFNDNEIELMLAHTSLKHNNEATKICLNCKSPNSINAFICVECNSVIKTAPLFIPQAKNLSKRRKAKLIRQKPIQIIIVLIVFILILLIYFYLLG